MAKRSKSKQNKTSKRNTTRREASKHNRTLRGGLTGVTVDQLHAIVQRRYNEKRARLERERLARERLERLARERLERERALRKYLDEEDDLLNPRKRTENGSIKSTALATLFGP